MEAFQILAVLSQLAETGVKTMVVFAGRADVKAFRAGRPAIHGFGRPYWALQDVLRHPRWPLRQPEMMRVDDWGDDEMRTLSSILPRRLSTYFNCTRASSKS